MKYIFFYIFFTLIGYFSFSYFLKFLNTEDKISKVLYVKIQYIYPLIGLIVVGNFLIIFNFFLPLKNSYIFLGIMFLISLTSLKRYNFKIKKKINIQNIFSYIVIPGILLVSVYDTSFNYDAGYYHLLHQSWLRESNLVIGLVNIFWPLGMSSIYEYLSAIFWFDETFVFLHLLNVYFIHFFYLVLKDNLFSKKNKSLTNISIIILIFSILDNFGFGGGRNGFIYIQGVTKQDITVGILFWFLSIIIIKKIIEKNIQDIEIVLISLISFFLYEIKVSGFFIFYIYAFLILDLLISKTYSLKKMTQLHIPVLLFAIFWFIKSFLTTSCLVFPLNFTCFDTFDWYLNGSTLMYENLTKSSSKPFDFTTSISQWIQDTGEFEHRKNILLNFLISLFLLISIKLLFFKSKKISLKITSIILSYLFINLIYLFFFGPIPRYFIGICLLLVSIIGLYSDTIKLNFSDFLKYSLIITSVFLLVRSTSYVSLISNQQLRLFNPTNNQEIAYLPISKNWVKPSEGLQCWTNINCIPIGKGVEFKNYSIFKIAYKLVD